QINTVINSGSTGRIAEDIGSMAMDQGWDSYIAYGRNDRPSRSKKIKIGTNLSIRYHVLLTRLLDRHGLASKRATEHFIEQVERINPDIVHLHNIHGYYINSDVLFTYLKDREIPVVWTLHDCWAFTGHCSHYMAVDCHKWKKHCY